MTGRGIDQILAEPSSPELHERYMTDARGYLELANERNGPVPFPVGPTYVWGEALEMIEREGVGARIINLETAVTTSADWEPKGINYRMNPANLGCLRAARIDCCTLANNHVLDWGPGGLLQTIDSLHAAGIRTAGAGRTLAEARKPAELDIPSGGRVLVFSMGAESSGIPPEWGAGEFNAGVFQLRDLGPGTLAKIVAAVQEYRRPEDLVVASLHWGENWGYSVSEEETRFAHALIDQAGVDVVHGHSSHHPKGIEVYRDHLILYGCGDLLNDYEGISGYEKFRGDLGLLYFTELELGTGRLLQLRMAPTRVRRFRLERASREAASWLAAALSREGLAFGTQVEIRDEGTHLMLELRWSD